MEATRCWLVCIVILLHRVDKFDSQNRNGEGRINISQVASRFLFTQHTAAEKEGKNYQGDEDKKKTKISCAGNIHITDNCEMHWNSNKLRQTLNSR